MNPPGGGGAPDPPPLNGSETVEGVFFKIPVTTGGGLGIPDDDADIVVDVEPTTIVFSVVVGSDEEEDDDTMVAFVVPDLPQSVEVVVVVVQLGTILNVATSIDTFLTRSIRISRDTLQALGLNSTIRSMQFETATRLMLRDAGKVGESGIASHLLR